MSCGCSCVGLAVLLNHHNTSSQILNWSLVLHQVLESHSCRVLSKDLRFLKLSIEEKVHLSKLSNESGTTVAHGSLNMVPDIWYFYTSILAYWLQLNWSLFPGDGLGDDWSCHVIFHCVWRSDVSALHWKDIGELKMRGIHNVLCSADNNDRSYCFGRPALWLMRHWGSGVSAYDFFMALSELERRCEKVKPPSLGSLCHLHFPPTRDACWDAGTRAQPVAWPSFAYGLWKRTCMTQCLCERMNPAHTVSAGSYAFKNLMALKEQLLSHLNFATPCIYFQDDSGCFRNKWGVRENKP